MGVLDEAIREHLDLKRRRGATEEEIARAEAEALGPARRDLPPDELDYGESHEDEDEGFGPGETLVVNPSDAPPPPRAEDRRPTPAVHDIDEDPLEAPPPVARAQVDNGETVESPAIDEPPIDDERRDPGHLSE
jgi:hypothetical protein